jgi:hypothetical protein
MAASANDWIRLKPVSFRQSILTVACRASIRRESHGGILLHMSRWFAERTVSIYLQERTALGSIGDAMQTRGAPRGKTFFKAQIIQLLVFDRRDDQLRSETRACCIG